MRYKNKTKDLPDVGGIEGYIAEVKLLSGGLRLEAVDWVKGIMLGREFISAYSPVSATHTHRRGYYVEVTHTRGGAS